MEADANAEPATALGVAASFQGVWLYPDDYVADARSLLGDKRVDSFYTETCLRFRPQRLTKLECYSP